MAGVLEQLFAGTPPRFALVAPDATAAGVAYTCSSRPTEPSQHDLAHRLERALRLNPQYAWCVDLGQLRPARVARVGPGAMSAFVGASGRPGQRLGDMKPVSLSAATGWRDHLPQLDVGRGQCPPRQPTDERRRRRRRGPPRTGSTGGRRSTARAGSSARRSRRCTTRSVCPMLGAGQKSRYNQLTAMMANEIIRVHGD